MLLFFGMLAAPFAFLVNVDETVPGVRVEASSPETSQPLDLERRSLAEVSRGDTELLGATSTTIVTSTTAPPTTVAPATTEAPVTTVARAAEQMATAHTHRTTTTHTHPPTTTTAKPTTTTEPPSTTAAPSNSQTGDASYYDTADPEVCAHRSLPFGTIVSVTNLENGKRADCRVGDRGPYVDGRIIDLSTETFSELAPPSQGIIRVRIEW